MIFFYALIALFAATLSANAAPVGLAIAAFAGTTFGGIVINAVVGIALSVGASLLKGLLTKKTDVAKTKDPGTSLDLQVGGDNALFFPLGDTATGGVRVYCGTWANDTKTPNEYAVNVIAVSALPLNTGLNGIWFADQKITVLVGDTKQPQGWPVLEYRKNGNDYAWIDFHDGQQTSVDTYLLSKFGSDPDYPWQNDMIGRGVAYVTFTARYEKNGLWGNGLPELTIEVPSIPLYDIRQDSTAGGSGSQRWADHSTWTPSNNPIVQAYNVGRGIYYGSEWVYGGQNWPAFRLPASSWIAAMNACDANVGGEPQFRSSGIVQCDVEPAKTIEEQLKASSGLIAEMGGIYKVRVGAPGAAVYAFTDANIVVTKEQGYSPFPGLENTVNIIRLTYTEPTEKWANKESPELRDNTIIASDDNRELPSSVDLPWVTSNLQVQRIGKVALYNGRRFRQHNHYLPPEAWLLEPLDVVTWSSVHNGYVNKSFDLEQITGSSDFLQGVSIREVDPTDYDWNPATDPLPYETIPLVPKFPTPQPMTGWEVEPVAIQDNDGKDRRPGVQVFYAADLTDIRAVHVQVRLAGTTSIWAEGEVPYDSLSTAPSTILTFQFLPDVDYEVRGILLPYSDRVTEWSEWLAVHTLNILLTSDDIYLPGIVDEIQEFVGEATSWIRDGVRQSILDAQRIARLAADQDFGNYTDRQTMRTELASVSAGITADYENAITVATGPDSAFAQRIESLEVVIPTLATAEAVDLLSASVTVIDGKVTSQAQAITSLSAATTSGDVATANFQMTVSAGPAGYASRIGFEARAGGAGGYRAASLFLDVPTSTSSPSRVVMVADQVVMTDGTNTRNPFVFSAGVLTLNAANIGTVTAGLINGGPGSKMVIDITNGSITVSD